MRAQEIVCGMLHQLIHLHEPRRAQSSAQSANEVTYINIRKPQKNVFHQSHLQLDGVTVPEVF